MKTITLFFACLCTATFAFSQSDNEMPVLSGSWEITTADNLKDPNLSSVLAIYKKQKIHFLSDSILVLESKDGYYTTYYTQQGETLHYGTQDIKIGGNAFQPLRLTYKDTIKNRHFRIGLQKADPLSEALTDRLVNSLKKEAVGFFSTRGAYARFDEASRKYHYVLVLPEGDIIDFHDKEKPAQVLPVLHRHYSNPLPMEYTNSPRSQTSTAITNKRYPNLNKRRGEQVQTFAHSEYKVSKDLMTLNQVVHDVEGDTLTRIQANFGFYPFEALGHWTYRQEVDPTPGSIFYEILLLPQRQIKRIKPTEIFVVVEDMPTLLACENLPRGERKACSNQKVLEYIENNIAYPEGVEASKLSGRGVAIFIVEKDGSMVDINFAKSPGYGVGEEIIRIIEQMGQDGIVWSPGKQRGRKVRVMYKLPIEFPLKDYKKSSKKKQN